jgi:ferrous iron transport protein A
MQSISLSALHVGDRAEVMALGSELAVRRRIMDLGLITGTRFRVVRVAPLGDPMEIAFRGLHLTMRKKEAEGIMVRKIDDELLQDGCPMQNSGKRWMFGKKS